MFLNSFSQQTENEISLPNNTLSQKTEISDESTLLNSTLSQKTESENLNTSHFNASYNSQSWDGAFFTSDEESSDTSEDTKGDSDKDSDTSTPGSHPEEPLNSADDITDDDDYDFDTDNVIVCQYDKVMKFKGNLWKICLKDGIMNLDGRDFLFNKAVGEAPW